MWRWREVAAALVVAAFAAGCTSQRARLSPAPTGAVQRGVASWYGPGFHGKRTANGEVYDQHELTAAHRTFPLGTRVRVTNLTNRRSIDVRINDRGPFVDDRVIDLSYAAARGIGMIGPGIAEVEVAVIDAPRRLATVDGAVRDVVARPDPRELPRALYSVQVASFDDPHKAQHLRRVVATRFPDTYVHHAVDDGDDVYRVRIGPFRERESAESRATHVHRLGYAAVVMEEPGP